jgi:hypothetical protein
MSGNDVRPPIEPLSDISWQRVEKNVFKALDCDAAAPVAAPPPSSSPTRTWLISGAVAAVAIAAALLLVVPWSAPPAPPVPDRGSAPALSRVVTQHASTDVNFGDATITVGAESAATMHGDADRGVLVVLERGSATFAVAPRGSRPPFTVQAGEVLVRVIGTRFTVQRDGDAARVDVTEGHVEVVARDLRVQVRAGESWSSSDDSESAVAPFPPDASVAPPVKPAEPPRPPRPTARERFEQAAAIEATDPVAAIAAYRAVARGTGSWAMNALFAAGRLAAELHQDAAATLLRDYLRRFPTGPNVADARTLLDGLGH